MNLGTAAAEVTERLQDLTSAQTTRVKEWLNLVYQEIVSRKQWSWLEASASFNTVANTYEYAVTSLGSDVDKVASLRIEESPDYLIAVPALSMDAMFPDPDRSTGQPRYYTIWGANIRVFPVPAQVYSIKGKYYKTAPELTSDSSTPLIPAKFHWVWLKGAQAYGLEFNDDTRALQARAEFERGIMLMRGDDTKVPDERVLFSPQMLPAARRGPYYPPERFPAI